MQSYLAGMLRPEQVSIFRQKIIDAGSGAPDKIAQIMEDMWGKLPTDRLSALTSQLMQELGRGARNLPGTPEAQQTVEALKFAAESVPEAAQELVSIAQQGAGQLSTSAGRALINALPDLESVNPAAAEALVRQLAANGGEVARDLLTKIEQNPGISATLTAIAGNLLKALGVAAAGISTGALIAGAAVLAAAGLLGGYIWSHSGDKAVQAGPSMSKAAPAVPAATPTTSSGQVNCLQYCLAQVGNSPNPAIYLPCTNHIKSTMVGTEDQCKAAFTTATVDHKDVN